MMATPMPKIAGPPAHPMFLHMHEYSCINSYHTNIIISTPSMSCGFQLDNVYYHYHRVGRLLSRDERGFPLTQYITNGQISLAG